MRSAETGPEGFAGLRTGPQKIPPTRRPEQGVLPTHLLSRGPHGGATQRRRGHMTASLGPSLERCHDDRIHDGERADTNGRELNPLFVTRSRTSPILTRKRLLYQPTATLAPFRNIASRLLAKPHTPTFRILVNHCKLGPIRFASTVHAHKYVWFTH